VYASVPVWLTNVIVFGLWYWELDRGGPAARQLSEHPRPDFLFPQMSTPGSAPGWAPDLLDYIYTSLPTRPAFSPTDTLPLTPGEAADDASVPRFFGDRCRGDLSGRQHLELTAVGGGLVSVCLYSGREQ